jgi:translation initiation factor eIF-2B subunit alpha/methylthioribose-1-phosphate isomerase
MIVNGKEIRSVWFENNVIKFIDQRKLPWHFEIFVANNVEEVVFAIKEMVVRGAPAIGAAAAFGMCLGKNNPNKSSKLLKNTRPTAHDLFYAVDYVYEKLKNNDDALKSANVYVEHLVECCRKIGENGEKLIRDGMRILTHCNAGALATVDYGTALAPIRLAHRNEKRLFVYVDETRPRCQGLLTSWELMQEGIEHAVIADNAAGYFMKNGEIDIVIVGADRIAKNGDFANKIGTYEKAVLAKENDIPFYVAAPESTFDKKIEDGSQIKIEERGRNELAEINGGKIMPEWTVVKNPAFDVTPSRYVDGFITEGGIIKL